MRVLAIDYGTVRIGLALSDPLQLLARPYQTLRSSGEIFVQLREIVLEEEVGFIVVGMPYGLDGGETESTLRVRAFCEELSSHVACPIVEWDESFSSKKAAQQMVESGLKKSKRKRKETTDEWAAAIILQEYLDSAENSTSE